jgi:hypothetical protein
VSQRSFSLADGVSAAAARLTATVVTPEARHAASLLFDEVTRIYCRVLDKRFRVRPEERTAVRAAGRAFAVAGGSPDEIADLLGRLTSSLADMVASHCPEQLVSLVDAAQLLVREVLAGAGEPRSSSQPAGSDLVHRLLLDSVDPRDVEGLPDVLYEILVIEPDPQVPQAVFVELLDENTQHGVLSGAVDTNAVVLLPNPGDDSLTGLLDDLTERCGQRLWGAKAVRPRAEIAAGYREAKHVLSLVLATGRTPGLYCLDDVLVEYAVARNPAVADRLLSLLRPLLAHDVLRETLEILIRNDFNRNDAARRLYVHRSTLDYRIGRIAEITGYHPLTFRGAQVLSAALTASAAAGIRWES